VEKTDAGSMTIMINSGEMNGIPTHTDERILKGLLRDELGFEGLAVTDWEDIGYLVSRHRVAKDFKEAIGQAINAGIDMAMVPLDASFPTLLKELVEEGTVPMTRIDESVRRILKVKEQLGLFDKAYYDFDKYTEFAGAAHENMALQTAEESIILLKNEDNILPLDKSKKVLVVGPNADRMDVLNGGWTGTWQGADPKYDNPGKPSILKAMQALEGTQIITAEPGKEAAKARSADVVVLCLGELSYTEKPGDIDNMDLDPAQVKLVNEMKEVGKPLVIVLTEGRPRIVREIEGQASGMLLGLLPGDEGGRAIANVIYGDVNPSGKLPITYPKNANDLITYDHKGTDLVYRDFSMNGFKPQWEFGHGLSYTSFDYSGMTAVKNLQGGIDVSVTVTNSGDREGKEVVQVYVSDLVASITPSVKRLRAFEKVNLKAGGSQTLSFSISKEDISFVGRDNKWVFEPGDFKVRVGDQEVDLTL